MTSGRTITVDWKRPEYFREKYHLDNIAETCSCGCIIFHRQMYRHKLTKKHARLLSIIENPVPLGIK